MRIFVPKEARAGEARAPVLPQTAEKLVKLGATLVVEPGLGASLNLSDEAYVRAGAAVSPDRHASLASAELVLRLNVPPVEDVAALAKGCIHISYLDPFNQQALIARLAEGGVTAISMEMVPRTTLAQKMDALSSQASLAGYVAVILAAERLGKIFPMMMTPAGTIAPSRVFVIGVGVAGLQAIATARRLGARVEAFDTRPVVEEQVRSLGAKFVKTDLGGTGQTRDGYAKALTPEQLEKQRREMTRHCADSDVVITAAQVFGRRAPVIVTKEMIRGMQPGSVVVDCAVETGGNVEGSVRDREVEVHGVCLIGLTNLAGRVPRDASLTYANNLGNLVEHFWDKDNKRFKVDLQDEIMKGCLVTHGCEIVSEAIRAAAS